MFEMIHQYKNYLEADCRFTPELVGSYLGQLPTIIHNLAVNEPGQIKSQTIAKEWQKSRWELTDGGIQSVEGQNKQYLHALKEFLRYLEERNMGVEKGISDIINLPGQAETPVLGFTTEEREKLLTFLRFHLNNDTQRRDTALLFLTMFTGAKLDSLLEIKIGNDGRLNFDKRDRCGDFEKSDGMYWLRVSSPGKGEKKIKLSEEVMAYVQFYIENRAITTALLFPNKTRKGLPGKLNEKSAKRTVERLVLKAGIEIRKERILSALNACATDLGLVVFEEPRIIVSMIGESSEKESNFGKQKQIGIGRHSVDTHRAA